MRKDILIRILITTYLLFPILSNSNKLFAQKVHLVVATSDRDAKIGESVKADAGTIFSVFRNNIPNNLYTSSKVPTKKTDILKKIKSIQSSSNDTIVFYYSGHGGYDKTVGQYLWLTGYEAEALSRTAIRNAIRNKNPRLSVIITDCCNAYQKLPVRLAPAPTRRSATLSTSPLFQSLFFDSRGFVDITSSKKDQISLCHKQSQLGSLFTIALSSELQSNSQNKLSWSDLFPRVQQKTSNLFSTQFPSGVPIDDGLKQWDQTALAYRLPGDSSAIQGSGPRLGVTAKNNSGKGVRITVVHPGLPGEKSGLIVGDLITKINGKLIQNEDDYDVAVDVSPQQMIMSVTDSNGSEKNVLIQLRY